MSDNFHHVVEEPVLCGECNGAPIRAYGYTYIHSVPPDLIENPVFQLNNTHPLHKIGLLDSRKIGSNYFGAGAPRMPRSQSADYQPLTSVHLIDGDKLTCWASKTVPHPDAEEAWIRIDLPLETPIKRIVLRKLPDVAGPRGVPGSGTFPLRADQMPIGRAIPGHLTIRLSSDACDWTTVFDGASGDTPDKEFFECSFTERRAKQIWILGRALKRVENFLHSFSISEVEIYSTSGNDVAMLDRGAGVTVSSTHFGYGQTRDEQRWLWAIQRDLGMKYVRVGYHDDPINWHWVEREKGVFKVDPDAEAALDYLLANGIEIVMVLAFGNRLYTDNAKTRKIPQLWEWHYETPNPPRTEKELAAWKRFVAFIVYHFKGRVRIFEIWNEWNIYPYWGGRQKPNAEEYIAIAESAIEVIREKAPEVKIMLGSIAGFSRGLRTAQSPSEEEEAVGLLWAPVIRHLASRVDIIGYHYGYNLDPDSPNFREYAAEFRAFKAYCYRHGFTGSFMNSEWNPCANYPPIPAPEEWWGSYRTTELGKAKAVAIFSIMHTALGVTLCINEAWTNYYPLDISLLRRSFAGIQFTNQQPQAAYYVLRNLATILDGVEPGNFAYSIESGGITVDSYTMSRQGESFLSIHRPGPIIDDPPPVSVKVRLPGQFRSIELIDPLNGVEQMLDYSIDDGTVIILDLLIRDYPLLIHAVHV